jgi:aquaporin Z
LLKFGEPFLLVLVSAGAVVVSVMTGEITNEMQVVALGLMVMVIIYFMGAASGAHLNPAVTNAFACRRHFSWQRVPWYLLAQLMEVY